jgi:type IX secretion system PorP/SprF family membrane protein
MLFIQKKQWFCLILLVFVTSVGLTQDPEFSQIYPGLLRLNPAFAGTGGRGRVSAIYRNQWPGLSSAYITTGAFYDQPVEFVHGGVGLQIINDSQGGNTFGWSSAALIYSYHLQASKDIFILAGFQTSLNQWSRSVNNLVFPDMVDPVGGIINPTSEVIAGNNKLYPDFSVGFLANYKDMIAGISIDHLAKPVVSLSDSYKSQLSRKWSLFIRNSFRFSGSPADGFYISPGIFFRSQQKSEIIKYGFTVGYDYIHIGTWISHDLDVTMNLLTLGLAMEISSLGISYSYDFAPWRTDLPMPVTGAHEFSLSVYLSGDKKNRNVKAINFSKF